MADITPQRIILQEEETQYRGSVSEATLNRFGAAANFVNLRQYDSRGFFLNGPYSAVSGAQTGVDGAWGILFNVEIIGVMMFNLVAGSSGTTTLDIRHFTASNTPSGGSSIFSTKPSITTAAGNNAFVFRDFLNGSTLENPTGTTVPVLTGGSTYNLSAGDMLTMNVDAKQTGGQNCGVLIYYRPR